MAPATNRARNRRTELRPSNAQVWRPRAVLKTPIGHPLRDAQDSDEPMGGSGVITRGNRIHHKWTACRHRSNRPRSCRRLQCRGTVGTADARTHQRSLTKYRMPLHIEARLCVHPESSIHICAMGSHAKRKFLQATLILDACFGGAFPPTPGMLLLVLLRKFPHGRFSDKTSELSDLFRHPAQQGCLVVQVCIPGTPLHGGQFSPTLRQVHDLGGTFHVWDTSAPITRVLTRVFIVVNLHMYV